jgi:hypothetical protein
MKIEEGLLWTWVGKKGKGCERGIKGVNMIKVHGIHAWKFHNEITNFLQIKKILVLGAWLKG